MSWSDIFYPENPEKREKIIRRSQELIDLMKDNFEATNSLIEIVNKHLHSSFSPITLDEKATLQENCDVMIERVKQIQAKVEEADEELKKKLDPALYEKLQHMSLKDLKYVSAAVKSAISSVCQLPALALVMHLKKIMTILIGITCTCAIYSVGIFAAVLFGLAVNAIFSAIVGHIEQGKLNTALEEYEKALAEFRPASKEYQKAINEIGFMLEFLKE
ncbi:single-pass membrane and coiled-coil domain-containing protein 3-like [Onychostoma macrolepis]|uniref:single-pass membrane and coiled-coil domain-containing protein 3-like n=1 Tax=Onychostoma macrolepis TaxID=369639 RepID=UPI00272A1CFF|nr:single-pass membrane and coiled-coil domain-containing protein 3-like [Onychostoma macrolepis]